MAIINVSIGELIENCPSIFIQDETDYSVSNVYVTSQFRFHDYLAGGPDVNTSFTFDNFVLGPESLSSISFVIETDGFGNIINPEVQYLALVDEINSAATSNVDAEFIKPVDTGYRDWYIQISFDDQDSFAGQPVSLNVTGGNISPIFTDISGSTLTGGSPVDVRNLTLLDRDDNPIDLGAISQVDRLILSGSYTQGEVFTVDFCGDSVSYQVTDDTRSECVAQGILDAILASQGGLIDQYISPDLSGSQLTLTSKEAGIPLRVSVSYSGTELYEYSTSVANVPSLSTPSFLVSNSFEYETQERGGKYTAILTIVSDCDYNTATREFFSWCYDLSEFDCCFVEIVKQKKCCSTKSSKIDDASILRNIIKAVGIMIIKGNSESEIQSVVDMGWSICDPLSCNCNTC